MKLHVRKIFNNIIFSIRLLVFQKLLIFLFSKRPTNKKKYDICICAIFKNESPFLREWIEYHLMLGVKHFYLYNNNSEDDFYEILKPYIEKKQLTLIDWPFQQSQMAAYQDYYRRFRHECQWVSFLDIDEFFCPTKAVSLTEWLKEYEKYPIIRVYFKMFGTSGLMNHDYSKLLIEQYNVSWPGLFKVGKCIINTDYDIISFNGSTHHCPKVWFPLWGFRIKIYPFNNFHIPTNYDMNFSWLYKDNESNIQINHYWSKAWDAYEKKRNMTDVYFKENPKKDMNFFFSHEEQATEWDVKIYRFIIKLKLKILKK